MEAGETTSRCDLYGCTNPAAVHFEVTTTTPEEWVMGVQLCEKHIDTIVAETLDLIAIGAAYTRRNLDRNLAAAETAE
jgi:hypothetical protein